MPRKPEVMLLRAQTRKAIQDHASAVINDELPAGLKDRVQALLGDLARKDLSMALLDLAQMSRIVTGSLEATAGGDRPSSPFQSAGPIRPLIYADDEMTVVEDCEGPTESGTCPRVSLGPPVACAGRWIMAAGWRFKVAQEAASCPVAELGIVRPRTAAPTLNTNPCDPFVPGPGEAAVDQAADVVEEGCRLTP